MKLNDILNEDFMSYNPAQAFATASGSQIASPKTGSNTYLWADQATQHEFELDTLVKIKSAGARGWVPEKQLSYSARNKLENLVTAGILYRDKDRYFITDKGSKWFNEFENGYRDDIAKSYVMPIGGITGIAK